MKTLVTLFFLATFSFSSTAQQLSSNEVTNTYSKAEFGVFDFNSEVVDYGKIKQHSNGERYFEFTNTGKYPIVISRVKASCGCTVPTKPKDPVLPGESAQIGVKYDTGRLGSFMKSITITSNASEPTKVVKIKGEIVE